MNVYSRRVWTRMCFSSYVDNYCLAVCRFSRLKCKIRLYYKFKIYDIMAHYRQRLWSITSIKKGKVFLGNWPSLQACSQSLQNRLARKGGGRSGPNPLQGIPHTWSEPCSLWVVSFTAVHNLNMLASFMSCFWWNTRT